MKLLLDTHCLIWALADAPQLNAAARSLMARADEVAFSEASVWEIGLKWRKGKINLQPRRVVEKRCAMVFACVRCRWSRFCCLANCSKSTAIRLTACCTRKHGTWATGC